MGIGIWVFESWEFDFWIWDFYFSVQPRLFGAADSHSSTYRYPQPLPYTSSNFYISTTYRPHPAPYANHHLNHPTTEQPNHPTANPNSKQQSVISERAYRVYVLH